MTDDKPGDYEFLPCGCRMYTQEQVFIFEPHSLNCEYYLYMLAEAARQNVPVDTVEI